MSSRPLNLQVDGFTFENDGWVSLLLGGSQIESPPDGDALSAQTNALLPNNFRWTLTGQQWVVLGELRGELGVSPEETKSRLRALVSSDRSLPCDVLDSEEIDCLLAQLGLDWARDEDQWRTIFSWQSGSRCELTVAAAAGGIRVCATVAHWECDLESDCRTALVRFLGQANACFRFARVVFDARQIFIESVATAEQVDVELPDSIFSVAAAFRAIAREVEALLVSEVARAYLNINRPQTLQAN